MVDDTSETPKCQTCGRPCERRQPDGESAPTPDDPQQVHGSWIDPAYGTWVCSKYPDDHIGSPDDPPLDP